MVIVEWWSPQMAGLLGGVLGGGAGICGAVGGTLMGVLLPKGKCKGLVIGMMATMFLLGVCALTAGLGGLISGQPFHVWYPLVLVGFILSTVCGTLTFVARAGYKRIEKRKLEAEEMRRGT